VFSQIKERVLERVMSRSATPTNNKVVQLLF